MRAIYLERMDRVIFLRIAQNPRWSMLSGARALNDTHVRGGRD